MPFLCGLKFAASLSLNHGLGPHFLFVVRDFLLLLLFTQLFFQKKSATFSLFLSLFLSKFSRECRFLPWAKIRGFLSFLPYVSLEVADEILLRDGGSEIRRSSTDSSDAQFERQIFGVRKIPSPLLSLSLEVFGKDPKCLEASS